MNNGVGISSAIIATALLALSSVYYPEQFTNPSTLNGLRWVSKTALLALLALTIHSCAPTRWLLCPWVIRAAHLLTAGCILGLLLIL